MHETWKSKRAQQNRFRPDATAARMSKGYRIKHTIVNREGKRTKRYKSKGMIAKELAEQSYEVTRSAPACGRFGRMMKSYIKQAFAFILALSFRDFFDAILNYIVPFKEQPRYRLAFYTISLLLMIALTMLILVMLDSDFE